MGSAPDSLILLVSIRSNIILFILLIIYPQEFAFSAYVDKMEVILRDMVESHHLLI